MNIQKFPKRINLPPTKSGSNDRTTRIRWKRTRKGITSYMTFLNPLFLIGLGAAAIPIIIHLLNLRKVRTIEFSTLSFLKELQRTQIRRIRLRQLLLLILRTLLIIFIVLAFARPALQTGGGVIGSDASTTAAILFDDSPSMSVYNDRGQVFRQAIDAAERITGLLNEGDNVLFLRQSDFPDATTPVPIADRESIDRIIRETEPTALHGSFVEGTRRALELLNESQHINRELYIVSDMQSTHWERDARTVEAPPSGSTRVFVMPMNRSRFENAAVHEVSFRTTLFEVGKPVPLDVEVRNYGAGDLSDHLVSVFLAGQRVAQQTIDVPAGGSHTVDFTIVPARTGILEGYVEIEDDVLDADNRYYFTLEIPEQIRVLFVASSRNDIRFIETALATRADETGASAIGTTYVPADNLAATDISRYHTVIAVNIPSLSDTQVERIVRYVEQGGGFILFPGNDIDIENYNRGILSSLRLPDIIEWSTAPEDRPGIQSFDRIDYDHPIFQDIFEERLRERATGEERIESPRIQRVIGTRPVGETDAPVITLGDDLLFLLSARRGSGTVLFYTVYPTLGWSDFPVRGIFVPLMHRSVLYTSAVDRHSERFIAGETIETALRATQERLRGEYVLVHPDNTEERVQSDHFSAVGVLRFVLGNIREQGIYRLVQNGETVRAFAVNVSPGESTSSRLEPGEIETVLGEFGLENVYIASDDELLETAVLESRYGRELWKLFAFLAFVTAVLETMLARDPKRSAEADQKLS
jgi:hypothetical protein